MKLIDEKKQIDSYFEFAKSGSYYAEDLKKLPDCLQEIIETDKIIKPSHCTHRLLKELLEILILRKEPRYKCDLNSEPVIDALCQWIRRDQEFLKLEEDYSLDKGILLSGSVGCGKSLIMQALVNLVQIFAFNRSDLHVPYFSSVESYEVAHEYSKKGYEVFDTGIHRDGSYSGRQSLLDTWLFIDDIGSEPIVSHFGNQVNIIGELLLMRYSKPYKTAGTTNLDVKSLKSFYGDRVYSRMRERFNFIHMKGNDRRK